MIGSLDSHQQLRFVMSCKIVTVSNYFFSSFNNLVFDLVIMAAQLTTTIFNQASNCLPGSFFNHLLLLIFTFFLASTINAIDPFVACIHISLCNSFLLFSSYLIFFAPFFISAFTLFHVGFYFKSSISNPTISNSAFLIPILSCFFPHQISLLSLTHSSLTQLHWQLHLYLSTSVSAILLAFIFCVTSPCKRQLKIFSLIFFSHGF